MTSDAIGFAPKRSKAYSLADSIPAGQHRVTVEASEGRCVDRPCGKQVTVRKARIRQFQAR